MSNEKGCEKHPRRKTKVFCSTVIGAELVGPKVRLKSVIDGKWVNIPIPYVIAMGGRRRLDEPSVGCLGESM